MTKQSVVEFRVRYSETDQMGTYSNSRVLEWFECGRTEFFRQTGTSYAEMEDRGVLLPVVESYVKYVGRARYDDLLEMTTTGRMVGKARIRCDVKIVHAATGAPVAEGYTVHAFTNSSGRPVRAPEWFIHAMEDGASR
ncbi:MAG: thioesterase family protein [Planctomycetota bacterium]|nr:thioesterase family protein [Planctomycetota bacterium]